MAITVDGDVVGVDSSTVESSVGDDVGDTTTDGLVVGNDAAASPADTVGPLVTGAGVVVTGVDSVGCVVIGASVGFAVIGFLVGTFVGGDVVGDGVTLFVGDGVVIGFDVVGEEVTCCELSISSLSSIISSSITSVKSTIVA